MVDFKNECYWIGFVLITSIKKLFVYNVNQGRLFSIDIDFWKLLILCHMTEIVFIFNFKVYTIEVLTKLFLTEKI